MSDVPEEISRFGADDVVGQVVPWARPPWESVFAGRHALLDDLEAHVRAAGGITRSFVHERNAGDPVDLFLLSMAWGYGKVGYGPSRVAGIMATPDVESRLTGIVDATRAGGAEEGWKALFRTHRIGGLNMSFGTKLLYFAGYESPHGVRPLILDELVRAALQHYVQNDFPLRPDVVKLDDYLAYCKLGEEWSSQLGRADVLEYALFALGKEL